jgi:hypothetical protein
MEPEETVVEVRKHKGWPKGKPRKPRIAAISEVQPSPAPIFVRVRMKGMEPFDIECSHHFVENGFHVFVYPSLRDRFRQTRREIAISEVIDIEITAAFDFTRSPALPDTPARILPVPEIHPPGGGRPIIHSAREDGLRRLQMAAEQPVGSVKIDEVPGISFGGSEA